MSKPKLVINKKFKTKIQQKLQLISGNKLVKQNILINRDIPQIKIRPHSVAPH